MSLQKIPVHQLNSLTNLMTLNKTLSVAILTRKCLIKCIINLKIKESSLIVSRRGYSKCSSIPHQLSLEQIHINLIITIITQSMFRAISIKHLCLTMTVEHTIQITVAAITISWQRGMIVQTSKGSSHSQNRRGDVRTMKK